MAKISTSKGGTMKAKSSKAKVSKAKTASGGMIKNMRLLAQHPLDGFGNCGEGLALQRTRDGRRILWIAHESAPKNVTAVDVTNPKKPAMVTQTDLPHNRVRSNSLDLVGDLLVVAYQTSAPGLKPAGIEIFDVGDPAKPRTVGFFDASGATSRGVH